MSTTILTDAPGLILLRLLLLRLPIASMCKNREYKQMSLVSFVALSC